MLIYPDWPPAPSCIKACTTTRLGGESQAPYDSFNLALHSCGNNEHVKANREKLKKTLGLSTEPFWLNQTHSTKVVRLEAQDRDADGSYTNQKAQTCIVLTADCLPVLICSKAGDEIAAVHAGWRGLAQGILKNALLQFKAKPEELLVWLGPAIGPENFEVGEEVKEAFSTLLGDCEYAFKQNKPKHYLADLYALARQQLTQLGCTAVYGGNFCTFSDQERFYSYRRDGQTGRMASLIWISSTPA